MAHDLVIRGGHVADGLGGEPLASDVAVDGDTITAVGRVSDRGREEIDAADLLVTPGFVDIHTHYDGQATWDSRLTPSSWHGVTTVVMGNCGVGFAPVRPDAHDRLISLMEGVEDIPGTVLDEGINWTWESFGEYLDALDARPHDMDLGAQLPHGALRLYVMGERAARLEEATPEDAAAMRSIAAEAMRAGAMGFSTSRTLNHRTATGNPTPSLRACPCRSPWPRTTAGPTRGRACWRGSRRRWPRGCRCGRRWRRVQSAWWSACSRRTTPSSCSRPGARSPSSPWPSRR